MLEVHAAPRDSSHYTDNVKDYTVSLFKSCSGLQLFNSNLLNDKPIKKVFG